MKYGIDALIGNIFPFLINVKLFLPVFFKKTGGSGCRCRLFEGYLCQTCYFPGCAQYSDLFTVFADRRDNRYLNLPQSWKVNILQGPACEVDHSGFEILQVKTIYLDVVKTIIARSPG